MAIQVVENKLQVGLGPMAQRKGLNELAVIQPAQLWSQLTDLQQRQVVRSLVQVGRQLLQQVPAQEVNDEHT
jgi:hypothetical protein